MSMKNSYVITFVFIFILSACHNQKDDLDIIRAFKPEDKYFKANIVSLHFIIETSNIDKIDTVFTNILQTYDLPVDASGCSDGIYKGESPLDAYDYKHSIKIEIKDEKIVRVDYNEVHSSGIGKQEDEKYCKEMSVTGTSPALAYPDKEDQLLKKQNLVHIDGVSGASYSLYRFRYATTIALIKAKLKKM
jgi:major membrane immunogen (membrane-anchored lipoprotein)